MKTVLFVCTGNTCRSPMAEGYLKQKGLKDVKVFSAGIYSDNSPANEKAIEVCKEFSIDISKHISSSLTKELLSSADYIVCMTPSHKQLLDSLLGQDKAIILGGGIPDPFGHDQAVYRECFLKIKSAVDDFCERYL